jgi:hypothetical protein
MKFFGSALTTIAWSSIALVSVGTASRAADIAYGGLDRGVVTGLAGIQDLEPVDAAPARLTPTAASTFTYTIEARSSTPDADRSRSYASADPFSGTRAVLPLLVADLSPNRSAGVRPLTGRSVGARPSLPLARPESR